ncbi:hypothetical protein CWS20_22335 [Cytobacillus horneckiae]|uniref:Uncharacterized protein n=1 Tax=Cytobacillus horneckiae TaxID=549687 RepID=A0A2N0ZB28_9BACI|nr:hypothetical protein CWS20_22335 [Cytobacillus horneckiae]
MKHFLIRNFIIYFIVSIITSITVGITFTEYPSSKSSMIVFTSLYVFPFIFILGLIPNLIYELLSKKTFPKFNRIIIKSIIYVSSLITFYFIIGKSFYILSFAILAASLYFLLDEWLRKWNKKTH